MVEAMAEPLNASKLHCEIKRIIIVDATANDKSFSINGHALIKIFLSRSRLILNIFKILG